MAQEKGFTIEVSSRYDGFWRYNVALMCGCFDDSDKRTGFASTESHIADAGSNLPEKPADVPDSRQVELTTPACNHLLLYAYIVPHTLPLTRDIDDTRPFEININIRYDGKKLRTETRPINQWSGASIEMPVSKEGSG